MNTNICPQCEENLPSRLQSGRLICKNCGWSDRDKKSINSANVSRNSIVKIIKENPSLPLLLFFLVIAIPVIASRKSEGPHNAFNYIPGLFNFLSTPSTSDNSADPAYSGETKCSANGCTFTDQNGKVLIKNECSYNDDKLICKNYSN
jgi:hypothetical protein